MRTPSFIKAIATPAHRTASHVDRGHGTRRIETYLNGVCTHFLEIDTFSRYGTTAPGHIVVELRGQVVTHDNVGRGSTSCKRRRGRGGLGGFAVGCRLVDFVLLTAPTDHGAKTRGGRGGRADARQPRGAATGSVTNRPAAGASESARAKAMERMTAQAPRRAELREGELRAHDQRPGASGHSKVSSRVYTSPCDKGPYIRL